MTTNIDMPSPFNFENEPRICEACDKQANFVGCDIEADTEIYRCPCGELKYEKPAVKNL